MEDSINLSFEYSKELETERVMSAISYLDWYISNGYGIDIITFPKNLDKQNLTDASQEEISKAIELEYDETKYISAEKDLAQVYDHHKAKLFQFIQTIGVPVIPHIVVQLTIYGMAGSYSLPNKVVADIAKSHNIGLLRLIFHEIVHLHIEHLIETHHVGQWPKERIVDLLMIKLLPDMAKPQHMPIDTTAIDTAFNTNYPNVARIVETVGALG